MTRKEKQKANNDKWAEARKQTGRLLKARWEETEKQGEVELFRLALELYAAKGPHYPKQWRSKLRDYLQAKIEEGDAEARTHSDSDTETGDQ